MKKIAIFTLMIFMALGSAQAQSSKETAVSNNATVMPEAYFRTVIQNLTTAYSLNNEQQFAVKKAAGTLAENARNAGNIDQAKRENLHNDFNTKILSILAPEQKGHYRNVQSATLKPTLDAIIDSAKKSNAAVGK